MKHPKHFLKNNSGASLIEYGMLTGLVAVAAITAVLLTGEHVRENLTNVGDQLFIHNELAAGNDPSAACYNPANVGQVGTGRWPACEGMLIVGDAMIAQAASSAAGGDESYDIKPGDPYAPAGLTETYTFADSDHNIFTGQVADMSALFKNDTSWNGDIGYWNTRSATSMAEMFYQAIAFNQDIGSWTTSNVTDMNSMFLAASSFNQDISGWSVSGVQNMTFMFGLATDFNQPIGNWGEDTANVTSMNSMFYSAPNFNQSLSAWNTSSVTDMGSMFESALNFNQDIGSWETGSVTNMSRMFMQAGDFNADLSGWCVSNFTSGAPSQFDMMANSWTAARPDWGNCPTP